MQKKIKKQYKIAIVAPTAFYYHAPLYRLLSDNPEIDLTVFYCSNETTREETPEEKYKTKGSINEKDLLSGYKCVFLKNFSPWSSYLIWPGGLVNFGIWKEIKKGKYDAVILQAWTDLTWYLAFWACLKFRTPVLFMTDTNLWKPTQVKWKEKVKKILLGKILFKSATGFLAAGKANQQLYKHYGVPQEKIVTMPFVWGYEHFLSEAEKLKSKRENIRALLDIKKDDFVLLYVGRLSEEKNISDLLDSYDIIDCKNKRLFIVGDGPLYSQLLSHIKEKNIKGVNITGFRSFEKTSEFYVAADVLVLPSRHEQWAKVVAEAMCFGLPIIASDKVGNVLDLIRDGYNGFIFPAGNIEKLSESIKKIINLPEKTRVFFGERSKETISAWINNANPAEKIIKLLKKYARE